MPITHAYTNPIADGGDATLLRPSNWNAAHTITNTGQTLYRRGTAVNIASSTAETDLLSYSVPGGTLGTANGLRFTIWGVWLNSTGANRTYTLRVRYNSTVLIADASGNIASNAATRVMRITGEILANGATNSQIGWLNVGLSAPTAMTTGLGDYGVLDTRYSVGSSTTGGIAVDSTAARTLQVTIALSLSSVSLTFDSYYAALELL